jgi:aspartate-semialdehyde dehydrogenase
VLRAAVIGATGAVGREVLTLLDRDMVPVDRVVPVASEASVGRDLNAELGLALPMNPVTTLAVDDLDVDLGEVDVAIFCAGAQLSLRSAQDIAARGVFVVDNSSAFRQRPDVPLVVPEVNAHEIAHRPASNLVANPNCSTIQLVRALQPLRELAGLEQVVVSTYQAASGGGQRGLAELAAASARVLADARSPIEAAGRFGQPLAFNVVPEIGLPDDTGFAHEERKLASEPCRILGMPRLRISATAVRVPVFDCHSEAVYVRTTSPISAESVEDALDATPGIRVYRRSERPNYPMPRLVAASDADRALVHVGRIRTDAGDDHALWLWIVADNLWVGAALNALQIIAVAVKRGWLG